MKTNMPKVPTEAVKAFVDLVYANPDVIPLFCGCFGAIGNAAMSGKLHPSDPAVLTAKFWFQNLPEDMLIVLTTVSEVMEQINSQLEAMPNALDTHESNLSRRPF